MEHSIKRIFFFIETFPKFCWSQALQSNLYWPAYFALTVFSEEVQLYELLRYWWWWGIAVKLS